MLIRLDQQESPRRLEDVFQSIRDKTYEDSGAGHISKVSRDSQIRGMPGSPTKVK